MEEIIKTAKEYWVFAKDSILLSWQIGYGCFGFLEVFCILISTFCKVQQAKSEQWEQWEDRIMKGALYLLIGSFLVSAFFVAPFVQIRGMKAMAKPVVGGSAIRGNVARCHVNVANLNNNANINTNITLVTFELRLTNPGRPSTAWNWKLSAITTQNETFTSSALDLAASTKIKDLGSTNWYEYKSERYLPFVMLEKPVGDGAGFSGWVAFLFPQVPMSTLAQNGTKFVIEFEQSDFEKRFIEHVFIPGK